MQGGLRPARTYHINDVIKFPFNKKGGSPPVGGETGCVKIYYASQDFTILQMTGVVIKLAQPFIAGIKINKYTQKGVHAL